MEQELQETKYTILKVDYVYYNDLNQFYDVVVDLDLGKRYGRFSITNLLGEMVYDLVKLFLFSIFKSQE